MFQLTFVVRPFFNALLARFLIETKRNIVTLCGLGE